MRWACSSRTQINAAQRYQQACGADQQQTLTQLTNAVGAGTIASPATAVTPLPVATAVTPVDPAQAARMLAALGGAAASSAPTCPLTTSLDTLLTLWLAPAADNLAAFWLAQAASGAFLDLVLYALTQGYVDPTSGALLANEIKTNLVAHGSGTGQSVTTVAILANTLPSDWQAFFAPPPANTIQVNLLPTFTLPGTPQTRVAAFIRYVQKFFDMGTVTPSIGSAASSGPLLLGAPSFDLITQTLAQYGTFTFGNPLNLANLTAAAANVVPPLDLAAQAWVVQAIETINELTFLAKLGQTAAFQFSVMEALFARGFTSRESVLDLPFTDFQQALTGTIAYDSAKAIYGNAGAPLPFPTPGTGTFTPINPGLLTDCIPPLYLSPLGPVEYLHEMLNLSQRSTCDDPFAVPAPGQSTLGGVIDQRRGPVENLAVTWANLETPLPLIDIVNECLEYMASTSPITKHGTIYNTSGDALAGHILCVEDCCADPPHHDCHDPATLFAALPEYSTPATPVGANAGVEPAVYEKLKADFSACCLPYSQAIDVARTYLRHFRSCRFEVMRTFRKCITEFVLDPVNQPAGFQDYLWRYPVRIDIAIEYLGITLEEYTTLFQGVRPRPCYAGEDRPYPDAAAAPSPALLYGFVSAPDRQETSWLDVVVKLPEFLARTCLGYCEFYELWKSGFVAFANGDDREGKFPECEPCCLETLWLRFPDGQDPTDALIKLIIFIRLWQKLRDACGAGYSFDQLADICSVLKLFSPDFVRQLAAFQMLRDQFRLPLGEPDHVQGATGADRTWLLALWVGPQAAKWHWAIEELLKGIAYHAECRHECPRRAPEFVKLLAANLDGLSRLAGFDPSVATDTWHSVPTHTLRFAEVLAKIYASKFTIGELFFLFTAQPHLDGDDPFPLQDEDEALDLPLALPEEDDRHSLYRLRQQLLDAHVSDEEIEAWSWARIESALTHEFGYAAATVQAFAEHFFAGTVPSAMAAQQFSTSLLLVDTTAQKWSSPPQGPFQYDSAGQLLWTRLPLVDEAVIAQLNHVGQLNNQEQQAVQDLYFQPRAMLGAFAMIFADFGAAEQRLIGERHEAERWAYFRREFALCHKRCRIIADHLSAHVAAATGQDHPEGTEIALLLLKALFADENAPLHAASWQNDNGLVPPVTWTPPPNGGGFAGLLGLVGTGLLGEFSAGGATVWRETRGPLTAFGRERNVENAPVPTVLPSMGLTLTPQQMQYVTVRNGLAMADASGRWLGGAQGFEVKWRGALLIDHEGDYEFRAGAPTGEGEAPSLEAAEHRGWRVVLRRGQKVWILLRHHWQGEADIALSSLPLKRGAYELVVDFVQPSPAYLTHPDVHPQHTGFQLKYSGPDSHHQLVAIPHHRLFRTEKDATLADQVAGLSGAAGGFLQQLYTGSLRDIRRTYQRAFKALLFAHRFGLSARRQAGGPSELGYMLANPGRFAGVSYYRIGANAFAQHAADFDFNFLPVLDDYHSPAADARANPSPQRMQALFDWWERIFDYDRVRRRVHDECDRHFWLLFAEASEQKPANPDSLLRHMCADARHWPQDLHFFQDQLSPIYAVATGDLVDERWAIRAWHADQWLRSLWRCFTVKDITTALPDLWASDDPSALVPGQAQTGNANLSAFLCDGCIENGEPRRYEELRRLDDGLRERGRHALICYLCGPNGIVKTPKELSELLLLDVEVGLCERASRIEEAISAVQAFVQRCRLGLEPGWTITKQFAHLWDCQFASYHVWQACKRRELYKENWIDWHELERAKRIESFGFLDAELRRVTLTIAEPGGVDYWPDQLPPPHDGLCALQRRDPAEMQLLPTPREGLDLLATPERAARPSWITLVGEATQSPPPAPAGSLAPPPLAPSPTPGKLPFWLECAIRLGTRFIRLAAAAYPPASTEFKPRPAPGTAGAPEDGKKEEHCVECCAECGCVHPALMDEYYFWLVNAEYFTPQTQPVYDDNYDGQQSEYYDQNQQVSTPWHDTTQLAQLLEWPTSPMVRLAWCRIHNGEFQQPRRSVWGVAVPSGAAAADIKFDGRVGDSLYFAVTGATAAGAGFRYDIVIDQAFETDNLVVPAAPPLPSPPDGLISYPYFVYFNPGARLFPWSPYMPAIAVAHALRAHCRFEAALKWYERVYLPLWQDNRWAKCEEKTPVPSPQPTSVATEARTAAPAAPVVEGPVPDGETSCCCDSTDVSCYEARHRSILLHYLDTLVEWGDALMRRNSPEEFQKARLIFDTARKIMGRHPCSVKNCTSVEQTVATFEPLYAPINPRLMMLYDRLDDRMALIHDCLSARRLREAPERHDEQYWGDERLRDGWRTTMELCCDEGDWCRLPSPYRFLFLIGKAKEMASRVRELGSALLAAFEKGDAEYLASVRARHERELAVLGRRVREDLWRDADWQVQALGRTKEMNQTSRRYYQNLINTGLISDETQYVTLTDVSVAMRTASNISEAIAELMAIIPDIWVGFPCEETQLPVGTKLAGMFKTIARIATTLGDIAGTTASLDLTEAGWDRREQDWVHQVEILDIEIEQTELQILGAERRRNQALRELSNQERQIENSTEVLDFLRDKFTNHAVYLWLQRETSELYYKTYELALYAARQAEHAFNFERGHTAQKFIVCDTWDSLHEGLLAGERLELSLSHMEKEYEDHNRREYELTKHISLRLQFPFAFLLLQTTGRCHIDIPEWMFDLDYPGQYMRRIKSVSLTIPCVAGPYNGVHCRLTLLQSATRVDPLLALPPSCCCRECNSGSGYRACGHDPRIVRQYGAMEAIATSSGQNDSGLFELSFHDERYLPFEFRGAVSRWRIELPLENNYFDMETLSDVVLHLNYTAREGGERLRDAAREAAQGDLPGDGWCFFDLRHDFPDAWEQFRMERRDDRREDQLFLRLGRNLFPYVPGGRDLRIEKLALLFETAEEPDRCCPGECPCPEGKERACWRVAVAHGDRHDGTAICCVRSDDWPSLYHGVIELGMGPLGRAGSRAELRLRFPKEAGEVWRAFLLCRYQIVGERCERKPVLPKIRREGRSPLPRRFD